MRILLATKATSKTGIGHLVRSLLISSLLTENDIENAVYIEQDGSLDIRYLLKEQTIINGDLEKLNNITKNNFDKIIFDSYEKREILNEISSEKILISDSENDIDYKIDGILDFNFENKNLYKNSSLCNLIGAEYFPISETSHPEFIFNDEQPRNIENILISVGGVSNSSLFDYNLLLNFIKNSPSAKFFVADPQNKLSSFFSTVNLVKQSSLSKILKENNIDLVINSGGLSKQILFHNRINMLFVKRTAWEINSIKYFTENIGGDYFDEFKNLDEYLPNLKIYNNVQLKTEKLIDYIKG